MRFAVIGCGAIGLEHIRNINILDGSSVVAVADSVEKSLGWAREALKGHADNVAFVKDYRELFKMDQVDALIVCTPNWHHIHILRDILPNCAKHVMCEKPLCTTVEDCLEVREMVKEHCGANGRMFWVGMEYRFIRSVQRLIDEVDQGTVGALRMVSVREHRFPFLKKVGTWNRLKKNTGDTLVEKCCHFFDLMCRIAGPEHFPTRVMASGGQSVNHLDEVYDGQKADILDHAYVIVEFDNKGPRMLLELSMFAEASKNQEEISVVGSNGKLEAFAPAHQMKEGRGEAPAPNFRVGLRALPWVDRVTPPPPATVKEFYEGADPKILSAGYHEGATFYELLDFVTKQVNGEMPTVDVDDGLLAVTLGVAAHKSIDEMRICELSSLLPAEVIKEVKGSRLRRRKLMVSRKRKKPSSM
jgi:myo-inositol 2-dehydrogenase / D-chiro-inositol 1-dehydrogenase|eukprot:g3655.t1